MLTALVSIEHIDSVKRLVAFQTLDPLRFVVDFLMAPHITVAGKRRITSVAAVTTRDFGLRRKFIPGGIIIWPRKV